MRGNRGLGVLVAVGLVVVGVGTGGGGEGAGPSFPPGVEELLPHAVSLWRANVLKVPVPSGSLILLHGVVDVSGDGIPDLVVSYDEGIAVLFGDGRGGFEMGSWAYFDEGERVPATYGYFIHPVRGFRVLGALVEDLDGDGRPDLAAAVLPPNRSDEARLYLFKFDQHGSVRLADEQELEVPGVPLAAADFTGNGHMDLLLVTRDEPATVLVLPGEGDLRFGDPYSVLETDARPFLLADVNGSGVPDLGVFDDDEITVFLGDGRGGFLPEALLFRPPAGPIWDCVAEDLDGDGRFELVILTPDGVCVAKQKDDGFVKIGIYELPIQAQRVMLCDVDGDGAVDLVIEGTNGQRMAIYAGDGRGGFRGPVGEFALVSGYLVPRDLTGDGRCDFLQIVHLGVYIIYLSAVPQEGETRLSSGGGRLVGVGDFSGNGAPDLVADGASGLQVIWNNGQGGFVRQALITEFSKPGPGATLRTVGESQMEVVREGHEEWRVIQRTPMAAVIAEGTLWVLLMRVEQDFGLRWKRNVGEVRAYSVSGEEQLVVRLDEPVPVLLSGDLDGDATTEVVCATRDELIVFWGAEYRVYPWPHGKIGLLHLADFNGDGLDELFVLAGEDTGVFAYQARLIDRDLEVDVPLLALPPGAVPLALAAGDLDEDGIVDPVMIGVDLDVAVGVEERDTVLRDVFLISLLSQEGELNLKVEGFPEADIPWPFGGLVVDDLTGDGLLDIAFTTVGGAGVFLLPGRGGMRFGGLEVVQAPIGPLFSADLAGNGRVDLLGSTVGLGPAVWILWDGGVR